MADDDTNRACSYGRLTMSTESPSLAGRSSVEAWLDGGVEPPEIPEFLLAVNGEKPRPPLGELFRTGLDGGKDRLSEVARFFPLLIGYKTT